MSERTLIHIFVNRGCRDVRSGSGCGLGRALTPAAGVSAASFGDLACPSWRTCSNANTVRGPGLLLDGDGSLT